VISLDRVADPSKNHNLDFKGGMLQSWNKFCFTGGIIEASISLPGDPKTGGFWPAFWTMGNLGRAGYGASLDGTWPYSYDSCDVGTLPNQTDPKTGGPLAAKTMGDPYHDNVLSYLPGQRFSRCTCPRLSGKNYHPGPKHADGTWVGRSAPEIDM
jgi:beta-glucanase (GH16 family)